MNNQGQSKEKNTIPLGSDECPICKGSGYEIIKKKCPEIYNDDIEVEFAIPCTRCNGAIQKRTEEFRQRANIPVSFYDSDMTKFNRNIYRRADGTFVDISKQMKVIDSFVENFEKWDKEGMGLYIYSNMKGSGKTFLASCICNTLIAKYPMSTKFVSASNLLELSKQGSDEKYASVYDRDPIELLCNCKLLVIDDLGQKTNGLGWLEDILFRITDSRMQKKLVTIYTSNIQMGNLEFDDRIVDRINRTCTQISLPEYCVRSKEGNEIKRQFLAELGLV